MLRVPQEQRPRAVAPQHPRREVVPVGVLLTEHEAACELQTSKTTPMMTQ